MVVAKAEVAQVPELGQEGGQGRQRVSVQVKRVQSDEPPEGVGRHLADAITSEINLVEMRVGAEAVSVHRSQPVIVETQHLSA